MTMRPPKRSVHVPSGSRITAPVSTGVAVSRPNSVLLSLSSSRNSTPSTPNIIHTTKQTRNASVLTSSTDHALASATTGGAAPWMGVRVGALRRFMTSPWQSRSFNH